MNIKVFSFFITGIILFLFQVHPFLPFSKSGIRPDFILIFVIYIGTTLSFCKGAFLCFMLGYLFEVFSGANSGLYMLIYLNVFISIRILKKFFSFEAPSNLFFLILLCFLIKFFMIYFSFYWIYEYKYFVFKTVFFQETVFTLFLFPFVFFTIKKLLDRQKEILKPHHSLKNALRF